MEKKETTMKKNPSNYFIYISLLTIFLLGIYFAFKDLLPNNAMYIIPAFYIITTLSHFLLLRALTRDPKKFLNYFLGAMSFKMLSYLIFLAVMFLGYQGLSISFVMVFFGCYVVYTLFEILFLRPLMRGKQ
jgi:hypothetical protein